MSCRLKESRWRLPKPAKSFPSDITGIMSRGDWLWVSLANGQVWRSLTGLRWERIGPRLELVHLTGKKVQREFLTVLARERLNPWVHHVAVK